MYIKWNYKIKRVPSPSGRKEWLFASHHKGVQGNLIEEVQKSVSVLPHCADSTTILYNTSTKLNKLCKNLPRPIWLHLKHPLRWVSAVVVALDITLWNQRLKNLTLELASQLSFVVKLSFNETGFQDNFLDPFSNLRWYRLISAPERVSNEISFCASKDNCVWYQWRLWLSAHKR